MSDKPQKRTDAQGDDILEQVISQGLSEMDAPQEEPSARETSAREASAREASAGETPSAPKQKAEEKTPSPEKKNNRSSVYIYLLILFGAAFLMLLLAYFIQQRNSESTISDLRNSMNLSREEMMEEIEELEKDKETLNTTIEGLRSNVIKQGDRIEELKQEVERNSQTADRYYREKNIANALYWLERFCAEEDYLMAAVIVEAEDFRFNEKNEAYDKRPEEPGPTPIQVSRYLELRDRLVEDAHVLLLRTTTSEDFSVYTEKVLVYDGQTQDVSQETIDAANAAQYLWESICSYSMSEYTATAEYITTASSTTLDRLKDGTFQDSTVELFEQIKADLINQGHLTENEDGTLSLREPPGWGAGDENGLSTDCQAENPGISE